MSRTAVAFCLLALLTNPAWAEPVPEPKPDSQPKAIEQLAAAVLSALADNGPLAVIRPEAIGTDQNLQDLEAALMQRLESEPGLVIIAPDEVQRRAGIEFSVSPTGIAELASRAEAGAALFVRLIHSSEGTELYPLLVTRQGKVLLDQAFDMAPVAALAPSQPAPTPEQTPPPDGPPTSDPPLESAAQQASPDSTSPEQVFDQRRLSLVDRAQDRWQVLQGQTALGELELARMSGQIELVDRVEKRIATFHFQRDLGIGLTLGGCALAGLSTPLLKSNDDGLVAGGVLLGLGLAAAIGGGVLWYLTADEAERAGGPNPTQQLIKREEAEKLIESYNGRLLRELGLDAPAPGPIPKGDEVSLQWSLGPTAKGGLAASLLFSF